MAQAAGSSAVLLARAGDTLGVEVEPLDQYGNVAAWQADQRVTVEVACPSGDSHMRDYARHMTAEFTRSLRQGVAKGVDGASSVDLFTGVITVAGSYMMCLRLNQQVDAMAPPRVQYPAAPIESCQEASHSLDTIGRHPETNRC
jgi:hypothetical protein